ncbi:MAG: putative membrane protein YedE/YeeE [Limisphaerales bacterium]|jgi:uncharacterized membrane protein YedE/YeeE
MNVFQPWPWYISGPLIALVMLLLQYFGKYFGVSSNLRTICSMGGAARFSDFFKLDIKAQRWNLVFVLGAILGGFISVQLLSVTESIALNSETISRLEEAGFTAPGSTYNPSEIFAVKGLLSIAVLIIGGFLVGFGARYAGGCTSGHAISGLSDLQWPSLLAVIGFFIGGLLMTHLLLPILLPILTA